MNKYHKIHTIFKRDEATKHKNLLEGDYSREEFELLKDIPWVWTEKVDGTNIRVMTNPSYTIVDTSGMTVLKQNISFGGKSDNAQIPAPLVNALREMFTDEAVSRCEFDGPVCLYGEGYGPKIQKGGGNYRDTPSFILFDVKIGPWWLKREAVEDIAQKLGIDVVPIIGEGTLAELVEFVRGGFNSQWGDFEAEGVVARPKVELLDRGGRRIITKLKCRDFR